MGKIHPGKNNSPRVRPAVTARNDFAWHNLALPILHKCHQFGAQIPFILRETINIHHLLLHQKVNNRRQRRWLECWPLKEALL